MPSSNELMSLLGWFAIAAVIAMGGSLVAVAVRRWAQRDDPAENFTFQDLREMRARGDITVKEFATMRAALLSQLQVEEDRSAEDEGAADEGEEAAND